MSNGRYSLYSSFRQFHDLPKYFAGFFGKNIVQRKSLSIDSDSVCLC